MNIKPIGLICLAVIGLCVFCMFFQIGLTVAPLTH